MTLSRTLSRLAILGVFTANMTMVGFTQSSATLLVLNKDDNQLAIVDPSSKKVIATVPTGTAPHEVTVSDDGRWAYVSNYGGFGPNASRTSPPGKPT